MRLDRIYHFDVGYCVTDFVLLIYYVMIIEKVPFPGLFEMMDFKLKMFCFSDHHEILAAYRSVKKNWRSLETTYI